MNLSVTLQQVTAIRTMLADHAADDDERLLLDTIEGETDALEIAGKLLDGIERDEGDHAALTEQMAARKARRDRCEARVAARREALAALVECIGRDKLTLPEATISFRYTADKLAIVDPAAVPTEYQVATYKPSMKAINAAFSPDATPLPNWLAIERGRPSITVRRK